jgi:nitrate/nitrite transport system ATP-binding protein
MTQAFLEVENLARRFPAPTGGEPVTVFEQAHFTVARGEFVCVIGHSGCGKSTILNILAGLDRPSAGVVIMDGREVAGPSLERGVIFQNHGLLPWKSALANVAFAVQARQRAWSRERVLRHSRRYLELVGLQAVEERKSAQLSGGMRQRVGIARAFATRPKLLLMDEPFGALDALTRGSIQDELIRIWESSGQTVFMITHDVDEAILLADKIILMTNGPNARIAEIVQVAIERPRERARIIHDPAYYAIRNHLVEFLVSRSRAFRDRPPDGYDPRRPPLVRPGVDPAALAAAAVARGAAGG